MFSRILVPLDGTSEAEAALPYAISIARACGSRVTCLHVLDLMSGFDMLRPIDPLALQLRKAEMDAYLHRVASALAESGLNADAEIVEGSVAEAIVGFCDRHAIDLVVLSHSGRGRSAVLGPHAFNVSLVVAHSGCASLLVLNARHVAAADDVALGFRRILVPLDGSQRAECVLPVVNQLASASGGDVLLVHVVQPPEMPRRMPLSPQDSELAAEIIKRNRAEAAQYLDSLLSRLPDRAHDRVLVGGHSASLLHEVADQEDADLIVMSAHGYSAQTRWPYGSVAASFIEHGNRPLLLVQDAPVMRLAGSAETVATRLPLEIVPMDRLGGGE